MVQLPLTNIRAQLLELCAQNIDDEQLARELVESDLFTAILEAGGCDSDKAADILGYKSKRSVESMAHKSEHFPQPRWRGSLWSVQQLQQFMEERGRSK